MTAIIGFNAKKLIFLASDSQMSSYPYETSRQVGYPKIGKVKFKNSGYALMAKAGCLMTANCFQEDFELEAEKVTPDSPRFIADLAEEVMKKGRTKITDLFLEAPPWSDESKRQRLLDYKCEVMLAYFFNKIPFIYVINSTECRCDPQRQPFAAIGCAANVAASVLSDFNLKQLPSDQAMALAVYAIEECKKNDLACGGDVQMGLISEHPKVSPILIGKDVLNDFERAAAQTGDEMQASLASKLVENFRNIRISEDKIRWMTDSGLKSTKELMLPSVSLGENPSSESHQPSPKPGQQSPPA